MSFLSQNVGQQIKDLTTLITHLEKAIAKLPAGSLSISHPKEGKSRYYQRIDGKRLYVSSSELARDLAQKNYYQELLAAAIKERKVLEIFNRDFDPEAKYEVYEKLHPIKKELVNPIIRGRKIKAREWSMTPYEPSQEHPEHLRFVTRSGDVVRSKSEAMIDDALYAQRDKLLFRYEPALKLFDANGNEVTLHPDFKILHLESGDIYYWEHLGLLDMEDYTNKFIGKLRLYEQAGIVPERNLIITMESRRYPLCSRSIDNTIQRILGNG